MTGPFTPESPLRISGLVAAPNAQPCRICNQGVAADAIGSNLAQWRGGICAETVRCAIQESWRCSIAAVAELITLSEAAGRWRLTAVSRAYAESLELAYSCLG